MSNFSLDEYQYNYRAPQEPTYYDPTVWTASGNRYDYGRVPTNDNAGIYGYNENPYGSFYPQTASLDMTAYRPDGQLVPSVPVGRQSVFSNNWQQTGWHRMNWQLTDWQQASWLQTVDDNSLLMYDDTVGTGRTQSPDSRNQPWHDSEISQFSIVSTTQVPAISDQSHSNMGTSSPRRALWKDVDTRTKNRLKTWYEKMEITEGDEHDKQIWGDMKSMINKGETYGYVVCKKNGPKIHYKICDRPLESKNRFCTALHIHLSTSHGQQVDWTAVAECYRCQTRKCMSKIRRRRKDAKRRNEIEKSGKSNID